MLLIFATRPDRDAPGWRLVSQARDTFGLLLGLMSLHGKDWTTFTVGYGTSFRDDELNDGDVIIFNDPYIGGQHVMDLITIAPVRYKGDLVGFVGSIAHHADMGGAAAGVERAEAEARSPRRPGDPSPGDTERDRAEDADADMTDERTDAGDEPGMGVQFHDVDIDVLLELNDYFASLTGVEVSG